MKVSKLKTDENGVWCKKMHFSKGKIIIGLAFFLVIITACGEDFCVLGMGDCDQEVLNSSLELGTSASTVVVEGTVTFTPTGGESPYTFEILTGGGSKEDASDGKSTVYTAGSSAGWACMRVTDNASGSVDLCIQITSS